MPYLGEPVKLWCVLGCAALCASPLGAGYEEIALSPKDPLSLGGGAVFSALWPFAAGWAINPAGAAQSGAFAELSLPGRDLVPADGGALNGTVLEAGLAWGSPLSNGLATELQAALRMFADNAVDAQLRTNGAYGALNGSGRLAVAWSGLSNGRIDPRWNLPLALGAALSLVGVAEFGTPAAANLSSRSSANSVLLDAGLLARLADIVHLSLDVRGVPLTSATNANLLSPVLEGGLMVGPGHPVFGAPRILLALGMDGRSGDTLGLDYAFGVDLHWKPSALDGWYALRAIGAQISGRNDFLQNGLFRLGVSLFLDVGAKATPPLAPGLGGDSFGLAGL